MKFKSNETNGPKVLVTYLFCFPTNCTLHLHLASTSELPMALLERSSSIDSWQNNPPFLAKNIGQNWTLNRVFAMLCKPVNSGLCIHSPLHCYQDNLQICFAILVHARKLPCATPYFASPIYTSCNLYEWLLLCATVNKCKDMGKTLQFGWKSFIQKSFASMLLCRYVTMISSLSLCFRP